MIFNNSRRHKILMGTECLNQVPRFPLTTLLRAYSRVGKLYKIY